MPRINTLALVGQFPSPAGGRPKWIAPPFFASCYANWGLSASGVLRYISGFESVLNRLPIAAGTTPEWRNGRRAGFKIRPQGRVGSSPTSGTV